MAGLDGTSETQPTGRASRFSEILRLKNAAPLNAELQVEDYEQKKISTEEEFSSKETNLDTIAERNQEVNKSDNLCQEMEAEIVISSNRYEESPIIEPSSVNNESAIVGIDSTSSVSKDIPVPVEGEMKTKANKRGKVSKRNNPDYMQAIFHLPIKTSKRLDRELLDLSEAGDNLDRSEFAEELFQTFFKLSNVVGAAEALKQFRNMGS
ncbi:hypothetical protein [Nostoc sp. S13]|uniref:hypothetical protein n=1 Tax=Nostoc sp. S13 TaxID=3019266 RepID=UPI002634FB1D|nr:hypothetical protein [Nostoc sp. S13]MDF5739082.1 hypothetical protein [Nostoc sp. S13]